MDAVLKDLQSFRRDWRRWSAAERLVSKLAVAALALGTAASLASV